METFLHLCKGSHCYQHFRSLTHGCHPSLVMGQWFTPSLLILNNVGCGWVSPFLYSRILSALWTLSQDTPFTWNTASRLAQNPPPTTIKIIPKSDLSVKAFPDKLDRGDDFLSHSSPPSKTHLVWTCSAHNHPKTLAPFPYSSHFTH